jgi:hypothetical protein
MVQNQTVRRVYEPMRNVCTGNIATHGIRSRKNCWGFLNSSAQRHQAQSNVINLLRSLPMDQATEMLRQLRESNDLSTVLSSIPENSCLTVQPSNIRNARAISPPTGSATEFELAAKFSTVYPRIPSHNIQVLRGLLRQNNDDKTRIFQKDSPNPLPSTSQGSGQTRELEQPGFQNYCDSRLERLHIGYWSKIPISDDFAASLISFYINTDHKIMGFFDADVFLEDLVECRQRFCSSFLVSAVLCMACQGYTAIDSHANEVRVASFPEAEMLWQGERYDTSLISLAAMGLSAWPVSTKAKTSWAKNCFYHFVTKLSALLFAVTKLMV